MKKKYLNLLSIVTLSIMSFAVDANTELTMEIKTTSAECQPRVLTLGQPLQIRLPVNLALGQSWTVVDIPTDILNLANNTYEPLVKDDLESPGINILNFETVNKGSNVLTLSYLSDSNAKPQIYHCNITVE